MLPLAALLLESASPQGYLLFLVNLVAVVGVVLFAGGVILLIVRRNDRRQRDEERLTAMGAATARILHQVKNPVQTILLQAELLNEPYVADDPEARRETANAIISEAERLASMLHELSAYASGARRTLHLRPIPLEPLVQEVARHERDAGSVRLVVSCSGPATVLADPYYLRQAVDNLVRNAREAMEGQPDACITLALQRREDTVVLSVSDNGPGIPPDRLTEVLVPFATTKTRGMGLGLAICKEIVEGHRGRLEVRSSPGQGTTFEILLPFDRSVNEASTQGDVP